ncbi:DNA-binding anti-repressor SinI [Robertmurraya massiliosenegalensis]|nr:DNA-binding anti-repressor SinI [Robertmurraya massiliosenegalensis]
MMNNQEELLSKEWLELVIEAMNSDITKEEFIAFLESKTTEKTHEDF